MKWEIIQSDIWTLTKRMEVPKGWIVCHISCGKTESMIFIEDKEHEWFIEED